MTIKTFQLADIPPTTQVGQNLSQLPGQHFGQSRLGFEVIESSVGKSAGVQRVRLTCDDLSVDVLPQRGMGIWQAHQHGIRFGWNSPVKGPVHPHWVPINESSGLGWLEGFDELVCRCGLSSNGAPEHNEAGQLVYPLHGRIANLPAEDVAVSIDESEGQIEIRGVVRESRFLCYHLELTSTIRLKAGTDSIRILDRVTNLGSQPQAVQMLYHCNFGPPLLEEDSTLIIAEESVRPRDNRAAEGIEKWKICEPPTAGFAEQVYFVRPKTAADGWSTARLVNPQRNLSAEVTFRTSTLPCFTFWKNSTALTDGYVVGLEPATNFPNRRSVERTAGREIVINKNDSVDFELKIRLGV